MTMTNYAKIRSWPSWVLGDNLKVALVTLIEFAFPA
jgi:hypothetical protein